MLVDIKIGIINSPREIASEMDISLSTVRSHLKQIHSKAGVVSAVGPGVREDRDTDLGEPGAHAEAGQVAQGAVQRFGVDVERGQVYAVPHAFGAWRLTGGAEILVAAPGFAVLTGITDYALMSLDPSGRIESWNQSIARVTGHSDRAVIGRPPTRVLELLR